MVVDERCLSSNSILGSAWIFFFGGGISSKVQTQILWKSKGTDRYIMIAI